MSKYKEGRSNDHGDGNYSKQKHPWDIIEPICHDIGQYLNHSAYNSIPIDISSYSLQVDKKEMIKSFGYHCKYQYAK